MQVILCHVISCHVISSHLISRLPSPLVSWETTVVRWPDPNAPKNTPELEQSDHNAGVTAVSYHETSVWDDMIFDIM